MQASALRVIGRVEARTHTRSSQSTPHLGFPALDGRALRPSTNVIGAANRVRHSLEKAIHASSTKKRVFWVNTPIIHRPPTRRGRGALFRVSALDLANLPRTPAGQGRFRAGFLLAAKAFLTRLGAASIVEAYCLAPPRLHFGPTFPRREPNTARHLARFWMIDGDRLADLRTIAALRGSTAEIHFAAWLNEERRISLFRPAHREGAHCAKLEGIVGSEFVHM